MVKIGDAQLSEAEPQPDCQINPLLSTSEAINLSGRLDLLSHVCFHQKIQLKWRISSNI